MNEKIVNHNNTSYSVDKSQTVEYRDLSTGVRQTYTWGGVIPVNGIPTRCA